MTAQLPPVRELPQGRHDEIRQAILRQIDPDAKPHRRWFAPPLIATAAVAALALAAGLVTWLNTAPSDRIESAAQPSVDGFTAAELDTVHKRCDGDGMYRNLQVYNAVMFQGAPLALMYSKPGKGGQVVMCDARRPPRAGSSVGTSVKDVRWIRPFVSVDVIHSTPIDEVTGLVAGRVGAEVTRVTYTAGGKTVEAKIANGTFMALVEGTPLRWGDYSFTGTITAYDESNKPIFDGDVSTSPDGKCLKTPDGDLVRGIAVGKRCIVAEPWTRGR